MIRKDGQFFYGENYVRPKKNDLGEIIGFLCIGIDITDRKKWVDALRASEEKYRISEEKYCLVLNVGAIGYYETDLKGTFTYCNESFLTQILSSEKLIGTNFSAVTTKEQKREILALFGDVHSGKIPLGVITIKHPTPHGAIKYADHYVTTMKNADGEITGFHSVGIDVTDRVHAEEALRANEEKYRMVLNVGAIGYYETDLKGHFYLLQ